MRNIIASRIKLGSSPLFAKTGLAAALYGLSALLTYALNIVAARLCGPKEYGVFALSWNAVAVLLIPATLGFTFGAVRFIPSYEARGDRGRIKGFILLSIMAGVVGNVVLSIGIWGYNDLFGLFSRTVLLATIALLFTTSAGTLLSELARSGRSVVFALAPQGIGRTLVAIGLLFFFGSPQDGPTVLIVIAAAAVPFALAQGWYLIRRFDLLASMTVTVETKHWIGTSFELGLFAAVATVMNQMDANLLGLLRGAHDAGVFTASMRIATIVGLPMATVGIVATPLFAGLVAQGKLDESRSLARNVAHVTFWPSLAAAAVVLAYHKELLTLFGRGFVEGASVLPFLVGGFLIHAAAGTVGHLVMVTGMQRMAMFLALAVCVAGTLTDLVLIPKFGIVGAGVNFLWVSTAWVSALQYMLRRRLGLTTSIVHALIGGR